MFVLKYKCMQKGKNKSGFTLIELSFAIAFIAVLLITITLITNEIVSIYRKGYSIKTVNQVGRDLIDDFTSSIKASPPANIAATFCNTYDDTTGERAACLEDSGQKSVYQQYYTNVKIRNSDADGDGEDDTKSLPIGGVFCTGKYSYIWNTGYVYGDAYYTPTGDKVTGLSVVIPSANIGYPRTGDGDITLTDKDFRLLKIEDTSRALCSYPIKKTDSSSDDRGYGRTIPATIEGTDLQGFKINYALKTEPVELLSKTDADLALYDLVVFTPAQVASTNRLFYSASFILGTIDGSVDIMTASDFCKTPDNYSNLDFSYCAVNKFNFSTQASGI